MYTTGQPTIPDQLRRTGSPIIRVLFRIQGRFGGSRIHLDESSSPLPNDSRPIIFAANHTNGEDIPRVAIALDRHFYVVIASDPPLDRFSKLVCNTYGSIWLDRRNNELAKATRIAAQRLAVDKLRAGLDVVIFPEAVWNTRLTWIDGKPMLPFYRGVVSIAQSADAHIVPIILEYTADKTCHVNIGPSFDYEPFGDDSITATNALREVMASTKLALRERLTPISEEEFVSMRTKWRATSLIDWDPNSEVCFVQGYKRNPETIREWFLV